MSHTEMRAIDDLSLSDRLVLSEDVRLFRVVSIARAAPVHGRRKVRLQSVDGATRIMLVRPGREMVRLVMDD